MLSTLGLLICTAAFFAGRALARTLLRLRGVRLLERRAEASYFAVARVRRMGFRLAAPLATYGIAVLLALASLRASGMTVGTLMIDVLPDGPAARAGMESGDRILSINGVAPATWEEVPRLVSAVPAGTPVAVRVQRAGAEQAFRVLPDERGKIHIRSREETLPWPTGAALAAALKWPLKTVTDDVRALPELLSPATLSAPIGIARRIAPAPGGRLAFWLTLLAYATAHWWPLAIVGEILLRPRRPRATQ